MRTDISTDTKILKSLKDAGFTAGKVIPSKDVKDMLKKIYTSFEIKKSAKATDLDTWFEIDRTSTKINKKTTDCIVIKREKIVFV